MYNKLNTSSYMYNVDNNYNFNYDFDLHTNMNNLNNKLLCTFTTFPELDNIVNEISGRYDILYSKIFILKILSNDEYVLTYNIDHGNVNSIPHNTILVHRKKQYNVLYTINSLNTLIQSINNGKLDPDFPINWKDYKNSILLTQNNELKKLNTKIFRIIEL